MNLSLVEGPKIEWEDHPVSFGKLFYDALKKGEPDKVIMVQENTGEEITNEILLTSSISLARYLKRIGLTKADVIALVCTNSWKYFCAVIAGFLLGIPINCVNPNYMEEELIHCFSITEPTVVICSLNCLKTVENVRKHSSSKINHLILIDDVVDNHNYLTLKEIIDNNLSDEIFKPEEIDARDTVGLIMFSSGTSGYPKAVMVTHHNLRNCLEYLSDQDYLNHDENSIMVAVLPMFHIFGLLTNFSCIFCQSKSILLVGFKPEHYLSIIENYKATHLYIVPVLLLFFAKSPILNNYNVDSVSTIICGAAPVGPELEKIVEERFTNAEIKQVYGLTETSGGVSLSSKTLGKVGSAGVLVKGMKVKIVDPDTEQIVPLGEKGEIRVKSVANMKGYLKNLKETEESFDSDGFLKTGDLGYFDADRVLFIVDRLKEIIKYKGFQVSPAELEDLLKKYEGVADAAVVGKLDERSGEVPTAFVIKQPKANVTEDELVLYITEHVSREKRLYGGVIFTDQLPRNSTGKVLRRQLREQLNKQ